jgi:formate dehydrogenase subunit delta
MPPTVRLANDIAEQFTHQPHDKAARAIAEHINLFWTPGMRQQFVQHVEQRQIDLSDLSIESARYVRS